MNVIDQSHFTPVINLPNFKVYIRFFIGIIQIAILVLYDRSL